MPAGFHRTGLVADELAWLLTLNYAGRTWRFASEPCVVESRPSGLADTLQFDGGLSQLEVEESLAVLSDAPDQRSVSLELLWPDDIAEMIEAGHDLAAATGELAAWVRGTTFEERVVLVQGRVSQPEYGGDGEPIAFTLVEEPYDDTAMVPPASHVVTRDTWLTCADDAIGRVYPMPFGQPGVYVNAAGITSETAGSPALPVEVDAVTGVETLLVANGRCEAANVYIWYDVDGTAVVEGPFPIAYQDDGLDQECAVVDVTGATSDLRNAEEWFAVWSEGAALMCPFANRGLKTAGDVWRWMSGFSNLAIDQGATAAAASQVPVAVSGYIDDFVAPWEWLADNVLPLLPVSIATGVNGLFPVIWRHDARAIDAVDHLEAGAGISRTGRVRYERLPRDIVNDLRFRFALNASEREFQRSFTLTPTPSDADETQVTSAFAKTSALRYGLQRSEEIESDIVYSELTVAWVLAWRMRAYGFSSRLVEYEVDKERAWWPLGAVVLLTDDELHMDRLVALVTNKVLSDIGVIDVTLQVLDPLVSKALTTGPDASRTPPSWNGGN